MIKVLRLISSSLAGKIIALAAMFLIVPIILYTKFADADAERQAFLLHNLQVEGRLAAEVLEPILSHSGGRAPLDAAKAVQDLGNDQVQVKLLLKPAGRADSFFLVAANPPVESPDLEQERQRLSDTGILAKLDESCAGDRPLAVHFSGRSGKDELLTSISPFHTAGGCWVIVTSYGLENLAGSSLARPFSEASEVRLAMLFYALMAFLTVLAVAGTLLDLKAFARLARRIRQEGPAGEQSFSTVAAIPELMPVAREFDRMVGTLDASARALREAAEDNAHAFKAPIGAIIQSLEPMRQVTVNDDRAAQALAVIERALARLTNLVNATRRLDEAAAALINARLHTVDLAALAREMAGSFDRIHGPDGIRVIANTPAVSRVTATDESLETVLENLLDNAISFSPKDSVVRLSVANLGARVQLAVDDQGPGVPPEQLTAIFRRNFSWRPTGQKTDHSNGAMEEPEHFGIGLSVVRRTVEVLGGEVHAENLPDGGFRVVLSLPAA
ncbi:HAMP domain-containing sensor histidine kinase [Telmatospirillum sp.]|uniref:sensor histidine kinase n=1 Tax=Telmatospirillum sp. TaxID=2079197 RepID=UPI00284D39F0|nr:HAMP domain-containing sensor histidine kinase [Telmatospirillum sp.]MDR3439450.1 HAMP domain-containing sensor histidine kinase [Telmatospirillum sp.]